MSYKEILDEFKRMKVLVIGDAILDKYIHTNVDRISPEAPVQVAKAVKRDYVLGGAGNVANNLVKLGAYTDIACVIGNDEKGKILKQELTKNGIGTDGVFIDNDRPTTIKTRIMAGRHQMLRVDDELDLSISDELSKNIVELSEKIISSYDGVIISDYLKGVLTKGLLESLINIARKNNKPVIIGPKGKSFKKYAGADVIIPNLLEAATVYGKPVEAEDDLKNAARFILEQAKCQAILITRGADGMSLYQNTGDYTCITNKAREVYDVTGAGDTVLSVFGLAAFSGASYIDAAKLANIAAGIVISKVRTATVSVDEISNSIDEEISPFNRKVKTLEQLKKIVNDKKRQEKSIVFTNGCFDLLHIGHIKLLEQAKPLGDELIVAINSDSSIHDLKGPGRPIIPEAERAHIISSLSSVDYVIIFSESTPINLIQELKPDILVKGADYKPEDIVGKDIVESYGGKVVQIPLVEDKSTSRLIKKIASV